MNGVVNQPWCRAGHDRCNRVPQSTRTAGQPLTDQADSSPASFIYPRDTGVWRGM